MATSKFDAVSDADDFEDQEPTPITDLASLFEKTVKTTKLVRKIGRIVEKQSIYISQIPKIASTAEKARYAAQETREDVVVVRTRQEDMALRLDRIEKNGHPCKMKPRIEQLEADADSLIEDQGHDRALRTQLEDTLGGIEEDKKGRSSVIKWIVGIILSVLLTGVGTAGSTIWYVRGLRADLDLEVQARNERDKLLDIKLDNLPTSVQIKQQFPSQQDIQDLTKAVNEDKAELFTVAFDRLPTREKLRLCRERRSEFPKNIAKLCP